MQLHYRYDVNGNLASITRIKADGTKFTLYAVCNSRGDVEELRTLAGDLYARYIYDSWGNTLHIYNASGAEITSTANLAMQNPIRYRGYYYDSETGLYYVSSRYYDPITHRFINADSIIDSAAGVLGNNIFPYCANNPVNNSDPSGYGIIKDGLKWINDNFIQPVVDFIDNVAEDCRNFDLKNESETAVLDSNYFSYYKGKFVLRTPLARSGSLGILFISNNAENRIAPKDEVRHEYGHTKQLEQLGLFNYIFCIGIPSCFEWGSDPEYYRRPWEITADIFGGVQSRSYPEFKQTGFDYLNNSQKWGIFAWSTIE